MNGARAASAPLPPPPLPAGSIAARRRVHPDGRIVVNKQFMKLGPRHAGKLVTVIIEGTCYRTTVKTPRGPTAEFNGTTSLEGFGHGGTELRICSSGVVRLSR